jgi:hypothetical protein
MVARFLKIGLVRPSEPTIAATVALLFLARNKLTDELNAEDACVQHSILQIVCAILSFANAQSVDY